MKQDIKFDLIKVPGHWTGTSRPTAHGRVFACGACPDAEGCIASGTCARARPEDFEYPLHAD